MNISNKYSIITILILTLLLVNLNYAFTEKTPKNQKLVVRCRKKCQNTNRKLKRFCKKCLSLDKTDTNMIFEDYKIPEVNYDNRNSSIILLSNSTTFNYSKIENLIVFGDSHSVIDTNFIDMTYTGLNHSRGKNWPLYLIEFNHMKLWNYALGTSVINNKYSLERHDLKEQFEHFYENMSNGKRFNNVWNENNSLFVFWFGANDVNVLNQEVFDEVITDLFNIINKIYNIGGRNLLLFGAFPIHKNPLRASWYKHKNCTIDDCSVIKNEVSTFNNKIIEKGKIFFEKYKDVNIIYYSTVDIIEHIISNCNRYEFKNCINAWKFNKKNNLHEYFWVDSHISSRANKILAKNINDLLKSLNS